MQSIDNKLVSRIYGHQRGWVFSKNDFLDLGSDAAIRKALSRLEIKGTIRRVLRGVYDYPRISTLLNEPMGPDLDELASALARKSSWRIQPSENTALNQLGLSTQVPRVRQKVWFLVTRFLVTPFNGEIGPCFPKFCHKKTL